MAKKLNLDAYKTDTSKAQPSHNKYSRFFENEGLSVNDVKPASESVSESSAAQSKRINMAFFDPNYELIQNETARLGITCVYMINTLVQIVEESDIDDYIKSQTIRRTKNSVLRRKGNPAKRINLRFSPAVYERISCGAQKYDQTITQYVNTIVEVYAAHERNN